MTRPAGGPQNWLPLFLETLVAERGAARNTVLAYANDLQGFFDHLKEKGKHPSEAGSGDILNWLSDMAEAGASPATRARRLSAVRQLYRFATSEAWIDADPSIRLSGPKKDRALPKSLTEQEVQSLISSAAEAGQSGPNRLRNTCLVELLYATGLRVSELISLRSQAFRGDPAMLLVKGKGGKERLVPLSAPARAAAKAWLAARKGADSPWLFPAESRSGHLTRQHFFRIIKDLAAHAGISPARVSPHVLRHAFATHLLDHGADLRVIQTLLGHADVATTEIYTHVAGERLKDLVFQHHPLAKRRR